uniref:RING-type domain-containing protein n=1 Tax=Kalanchoe fedtschenkoi TaxID=63787 RepID=A0A7N0V7N9_KALFE
MEAPGNEDESFRSYLGSSGSSMRRIGMQLSSSNLIQAPIAAFFDYLRDRSADQESETLISQRFAEQLRNQVESSNGMIMDGEVAIRIVNASEQEQAREGSGQVESPVQQADLAAELFESRGHGRDGDDAAVLSGGNGEGGAADGAGAGNGRDSSYPRYDIQQQVARWIEQVLPFSILLLVVFIRQHLQVMFKSNDILRKQTALKGERRVLLLIGYTIAFMVQVVGIYWWYRNYDLWYPLVMLPPKTIPPFLHAIFIIVANDTLIRQAGMALKCILLIYYKNNKGRNYRRQGQMLTLVEYFLLFYRSLLPAPVWYRFFLNKELGSLFSSLMTGLYLTFKLTTVYPKVQNFVVSVKALSRKEVQYGTYATSEQVNASGDMCAICQEKIHTPILLRCKHIFCEDCVSEWFERERTCPLCRALVKPADLRSFGDGSTSLSYQIF